MKILVFEFMVGGGVANQHPLNADLQTFYHQGHSMLKAVCEDLLALGHCVEVPIDVNAIHSLPSEITELKVASESEIDSVLSLAAAETQFILLIAPESNGCLEQLAGLLTEWEGRFVSPGMDFIRITANKWLCHERLSQRNVACPETKLLATKDDTAALTDSFFPCVVKPIDGAGSEGVRMVESRSGLIDLEIPILAQQFVRGTAVSVAVIVESTGQVHFFDPGQQIFDAEPFGVHLRTEFPLQEPLQQRATALARAVVDSLPSTRGYFGIDMVLGDDPHDDVVIEVNPRLTTSYAHLRKYCGENLAAKFLL